MKPLLYQVLLIGALWVEWYHFQFQQIKHHRWTWTRIIFSSMLGILDEKEKMILDVLKCWEQDVMVFEFSKNIILYWILKGLCRKVWDFIDIESIAEGILKVFVMMFESDLKKMKWRETRLISCACWKCIDWFLEWQKRVRSVLDVIWLF